MAHRKIFQKIEIIESLICEGDSGKALLEISSLLSTHSNNVTALLEVIRLYRLLGKFEEALDSGLRLRSLRPSLSSGYLQSAQDLLTIERHSEALHCILKGLEKCPNDLELMFMASECYRSFGLVDDSIHTLKQAVSIHPRQRRIYINIVGDLVRANRMSEAHEYIGRARRMFPGSHKIKSLLRHYENLLKAKSRNSALFNAWSLTSRSANRNDKEAALISYSKDDVQPIQYWSQGDPPDDVNRLSEHWDGLLKLSGLCPIQRFNKQTAWEWIRNNNPLFLRSFETAFHYAVEADVFRLAFASSKGCIWLDCDLVPQPGFRPAVLEALNRKTSLLFIRSSKPWITNAFFIAQPRCTFFKLLSEQCQGIDFTDLSHDRSTVQNTFGPARYNSVFGRIFRNSNLTTVERAGKADSLTALVSTDSVELLLCNEATTVAMRPKFKLGYKNSTDGWKKSVPKRPNNYI